MLCWELKSKVSRTGELLPLDQTKFTLTSLSVSSSFFVILGISEIISIAKCLFFSTANGLFSVSAFAVGLQWICIHGTFLL